MSDRESSRAKGALAEVNPYAAPQSSSLEGGRDSELDRSDYRLHGRVRWAQRVLLVLALVALYWSTNEPWTFVPLGVLLVGAYFVARRRAPLLGLLIGFSTALTRWPLELGVLLWEWEVGWTPRDETAFAFTLALRFSVMLALAFVLVRGIAAAATLFGDEPKSWSLLRPGLSATAALSQLCAIQFLSAGFWGNYAAALELAWTVACASFVWKARGDWLDLLRRRFTGRDWLLVAVSLLLLCLFMNEYVWFARKVRVDLASWPASFLDKGLPQALVLALLVVFRPLVDELFFRGFAQGRFERVMPAGQAVIAQAMLFSAARGADDAVVSHVVVGLALGWVRHRARNLYAPLAVHVSYSAWVTLSELGYLEGPLALKPY